MDPMKTLTNKRKRGDLTVACVIELHNLLDIAGAPKGVGIKKASTPAAKRVCCVYTFKAFYIVN